MDRGREVMTTVEAINACIPLNNPELTGHLGSLSKIVPVSYTHLTLPTN